VNFISSSLIQTISSFSAKHSETFDLIYFGDKREKLRKIVNEAAKSTKMDSMIIEIAMPRKEIVVNRSAILLFEEMRHYFDFHD
jgi:hypothetical protein